MEAQAVAAVYDRRTKTNRQSRLSIVDELTLQTSLIRGANESGCEYGWDGLSF